MTNKMEKLITLSFRGHDVRTVLIDDEPWFVAADVLNALGYHPQSHFMARKKLEADELRSNLIAMEKKGYKREMTCVSETGLFKLLLRSDKPQSRPFQDWVTQDVLPSIRKHGGYVLGQEDAKTPEEELAVVLRFCSRRAEELNQEIAKREIELKALRADVNMIEFMRSQAKRLGMPVETVQ